MTENGHNSIITHSRIKLFGDKHNPQYAFRPKTHHNVAIDSEMGQNRPKITFFSLAYNNNYSELLYLAFTVMPAMKKDSRPVC